LKKAVQLLVIAAVACAGLCVVVVELLELLPPPQAASTAAIATPTAPTDKGFHVRIWPLPFRPTSQPRVHLTPVSAWAC
jgi:hypothetical protein